MTEPKGQTLAELDVQPGDVVEAIAWGYGKPFDNSEAKFYAKKLWTVHSKEPRGIFNGMCAVYSDGWSRYDEGMLFTIISRANTTRAQLIAQRDALDAQIAAMPETVRIYAGAFDDMWRFDEDSFYYATHYRDFPLIDGVPEGFVEVEK